MKAKLYLYCLILIFCTSWILPFEAAAQDKNMMQVVCGSRPALKEMLSQTGIAADLSGAGPFTFFAPSEAVIQKMAGANPGKLRELLMNQIVAGKIITDDLKDASKLTTMGGSQITVFRKHDEIWINGARISQANINASNGVMHEVENWLIIPVASSNY